MAVKAVYQDGVFKPLVPVDLPEGEWVELDIVRPAQQQGRKPQPPERYPTIAVGSKGCWSLVGKSAARPQPPLPYSGAL